jgi:hypothetical protein
MEVSDDKLKWFAHFGIKSVISGNISCHLQDTQFLGSPFEICTGDTVLLQSIYRASSFYHWCRYIVICNSTNDTKYIFDLEDSVRWCRTGFVQFDKVKFILNLTMWEKRHAARTIQKAFREYRKLKSVIKIQRRVLEYLYRPGNILYIRRKLCFEECITKN